MANPTKMRVRGAKVFRRVGGAKFASRWVLAGLGLAALGYILVGAMVGLGKAEKVSIQTSVCIPGLQIDQ